MCQIFCRFHVQEGGGGQLRVCQGHQNILHLSWALSNDHFLWPSLFPLQTVLLVVLPSIAGVRAYWFGITEMGYGFQIKVRGNTNQWAHNTAAVNVSCAHHCWKGRALPWLSVSFMYVWVPIRILIFLQIGDQNVKIILCFVLNITNNTWKTENERYSRGKKKQALRSNVNIHK